jgi:hypothetical protein
MVRSVDIKTRTAMVTIQHGTQTELRTIPLSELPTGLTPEKGTEFKLLLKKDRTAPSNLRIVRSIKEQHLK